MEPANPSSPPIDPGNFSSAAELERKKTFWMRAIWGAIALFLIPPFLGLLVTIFGMRKAFSELGNNGIGDPAALSAHIGEVLIATACGLIFSLPGLILFIVALIRFLCCRQKLAARHPGAMTRRG